jgi:hypothetical protein
MPSPLYRTLTVEGAQCLLRKLQIELAGRNKGEVRRTEVVCARMKRLMEQICALPDLNAHAIRGTTILALAMRFTIDLPAKFEDGVIRSARQRARADMFTNQVLAVLERFSSSISASVVSGTLRPMRN